MDMYWVMEYGKVFGGYMFLMFLWPTVVFWNHLKKKSKIYHFSFCVTVQIVLINTIVLIIGLFHILDTRLVAGLFYGIFLISFWRMVRRRESRSRLIDDIRRNRTNVRSGILEYILLFVIIVFGVIYFSYGGFQVHCYGQTDLMVHHQWVNSLVKGKIFPNGVYPEAMHCFIYCLYALFGIRIYSVMLYLQAIHTMVFFLSAYSLMREIFGWRYTPIFVIGLYLTMNINVLTCEYSIYRLQMTLPMEFGLHSQFICALFLIRYLKNANHLKCKKKISKFYWDENLFLFMMALGTSIVVHYHTTIMAFIVCAAFAIFHLRKIFHPRYMIPLICSVMCGCIIAVLPMAGALASGIRFESSINWGLRMINSYKSDNEMIVEDQVTSEETEGIRNPLDPTIEDQEVMETLSENGQKLVRNVIRIEYLVKETFRRGYLGMYGEKRGRRIFGVTVGVIGVCLIGIRCFKGNIKKVCIGYLPMILASFLGMIVYIAYESPSLQLPVFIAGNRFCSSTHMMVLAVMMMPIDIIFYYVTAFCKDHVLQILSVVFTAGIYVFITQTGIYHRYLYYSLTRYDSAVMVTNSIIENFSQGSYTIVSPYEELCQVYLYGRHEELPSFIENCNNEFYNIPTEYVFVYVEKKPIVYRQYYYFYGPSWLGKGEKSTIASTIISEEAAQKDISGFTQSSLYKEGRTILESKAYEWCQDFLSRYPSVMDVYYEDEEFVCYYLMQDINEPYNLAGEDK